MTPTVDERVEVRRGAYHDSVTLMRAGQALGERPGVDAALTAMATELNLDLLAQLGFAVPDAGPDDLVIAVRGEAAAQALATVDELLAARAAPQVFGAPPPPRTVGSAARHGDASLALISVPGAYAFGETMDALEAGLNAMVFSDNVPVEQELRLKDEAARRGLLVMGPDCGTALVNGVGLGFCNAVRPGRTSLIAASGTGAQQVMCLLDEAGEGVRHVLGVGGRDLSAEISGRSTLQALAMLDSDPGTERIIVVGKPPAPRVAELIRAAARRLATPVRFALVGEDADLTTAVEKVLGTAPEWPAWFPVRPWHGHERLCGLFSGGTLAAEASLITGVEMIDFGADQYTRGRAHPMIDPTVRLERLAVEAARPGVVLLDVVLGHGAAPDPATALAPLIENAVASVAVTLCGTANDPQDREQQARTLRDAGAAVFLSNAAAARYAKGS